MTGQVPGGKPAIKEVVDAHFHRRGLLPAMLALVVRDRAAPSGTTRLEGTATGRVGAGFVDLRGGGRIPLHRVVEVWSGKRRVWPAP